MPTLDPCEFSDFLALTNEISDNAVSLARIYEPTKEGLDDRIADYIHDIRLSALALVAEIDELKLKYIRKPHTTPEEV